MRLLERVSNLFFYFKHLLYPKPLTETDKMLLDARQARIHMLSVQSIFNETSGRADNFEEMVYRLLAAEKLYVLCLKRLRQENTGSLPKPYTCSRRLRGLYLEGLWYPFPPV